MIYFFKWLRFVFLAYASGKGYRRAREESRMFGDAYQGAAQALQERRRREGK